MEGKIMPSLHRVVNHWNYLRSQWTMVIVGFIVVLIGVVVVGSLIRAGENALAYHYSGNSEYRQDCNDRCRTNPAPSNTPCPWWNNSYHCRYQMTYTPSPTPCPWWNNSYVCSRYPRQAIQQPCLHKCDGYMNDGNSGTPVQAADTENSDEQGAMPADGTVDNVPTSTPEPTLTPSATPVPSASPTPINNVNNNNSSAVANVVVNPAVATSVSTVQKSAPSPSVTQLPETGPEGGIMHLAGIGSLVAAGTAYGTSRRELLKTVIRK